MKKKILTTLLILLLIISIAKISNAKVKVKVNDMGNLSYKTNTDLKVYGFMR